MKKVLFHITILFVLLLGCSEDVTDNFLVGGKWVGTAGYEDGEIKGEPNCYPFHIGLEFLDEETVFVEEAKREFTYILDEFEDDQIIEFHDYDNGFDYYFIEKISDSEFVLKGAGKILSDQSCYFVK